MKSKLVIEELIDIEEVSKIFNISISKIRKMCAKKEIPHYKFGRNVLFYKPEISKWIMNNKAA